MGVPGCLVPRQPVSAQPALVLRDVRMSRTKACGANELRWSSQDADAASTALAEPASRWASVGRNLRMVRVETG